MRLLEGLWNELRMHRAIWHRQQYEKLIAKVGRYLEALPHDRC